jgi:hypothetical protein
MSLPFTDPSLPSAPAPIFGDVDAARGDHLRANNSLIWSNLNYLDAKTGLLVSPVAGMNLQLYQPDGGASLLKFSNVTTGLTAIRGFDIGLDASEQGRIWNYENTDIVIGTNNTEMLLIDNAGNIGVRNGIPLYIYSAGNDKYLSLIHNDTHALISTNSGNIYTDKLFGIGVTPSNPLHVQSTTTPQVRIGYDAGSYATIGVADGGVLTIAAGEATGYINLNPGATNPGVNIYSAGATAQLWIISSDNQEHLTFYHNGTNGILHTEGTNAGDIVITNTTECTGADTGALQVDGGVHVAKNLYNDGYAKSAKGTIPQAVYWQGNIAESTLYASLSVPLPNVDDVIKIGGCYWVITNNTLLVFSHAQRISGTQIALRGHSISSGNGTGGFAQLIITNSATTRSITLVW